MVLGFLVIFCPLLALGGWLSPGLVAIWLAKAALNVWRLAGAAYLIYWLFLPRFGCTGGDVEPPQEQVAAGGSTASGNGRAAEDAC